jgi:mono/diheme cytochrome c family protein
MKKFLKWFGIVLGGLVGVVVLGGVVLFALANARLNKIYSIDPAPVVLPTDAAAVERGAYLVKSGCTGCHGENLAGKVLMDDPPIGYIPASNLTAGAGGIGGSYADQDWVRAIRHGVDPQGKALMIMPSSASWHYSDEDLGAIIAYLKSVEPVDHQMGARQTKFVGGVLMQIGAFGDVFAAELIDHQAPRPAVPERGATAAYGEYLVKTGDCSACHGPDLGGYQSPEPGAPYAPNITPGGVVGIWSAGDFIQTMRTGVSPYGRELDPAFMPWVEYGRKTDEDLTAMFLYLQTLPGVDSNNE